MKNALGLIETIGLAAAIDAADVAVKSANVTLLGMEYTKGDGMVVVKIAGDVGAVNAGVDAARQSAARISKVFSYKVIPRPSDGIQIFLPKEEIIEPLEGVVDEGKEESVVETVLQLVEEEVQIEIVPTIKEALTQEDEHVESLSEEIVSCNLCEDPKCSRKRGELHMRCLHYLD